MATSGDILNYLIAWSIGDRHGLTPEQVLAKARKHYGGPVKTITGQVVSEEDVEDIYKSYPTRDVFNNNRALPKSQKDKDKIRQLLTLRSKDSILASMRTYLKQCDEGKVYKKNLATFLNNIPDYEDNNSPVEIDQTSIFE